MSDAQAAGTRTLYLSDAQRSRVTCARMGDDSAAVAFDDAVDTDPARLLVEVLSTKSVPSGAGVSYGHTYVTEQPTVLARVAIGYGHGLPRKAGNCTQVTWAPAHAAPIRLPIVGRVAMDEFVVDAGEAPVQPGVLICVFGDPRRGEVGLSEWATNIGESPVSVIACLDDRVMRSAVE